MLQNKEAWLQQSKLAKMLCTGPREFGANRWRFLSKANTLYFRLCKICEFMMCILIVNHQLNHMHPWCSWECMLPGRCSPGKTCRTFWNGNIVLLPIVLGKVDIISSTSPGAEPPRDARDSGSARSHSTHLETSSSDRP